MVLSFEDTDGRRGIVTNRLEVEYTGDWEDDVTECVDRIEKRSRATEPQTGDVYSELVIELPQEAPIVEVERKDGPGPNPSPNGPSL